jgi:hypothetical protein
MDQLYLNLEQELEAACSEFKNYNSGKYKLRNTATVSHAIAKNSETELLCVRGHREVSLRPTDR